MKLATAFVTLQALAMTMVTVAGNVLVSSGPEDCLMYKIEEFRDPSAVTGTSEETAEMNIGNAPFEHNGWMCFLDDVMYTIQGLDESVYARDNGWRSGEVTLSFDNAERWFIDDNHVLVVDPNTAFTESGEGMIRHLQSSQSRKLLLEGTAAVLIVRVVDSAGDAPALSTTQLSDEFFGTDGDPVNLRSQYLDCSGNKLDMAPTPDATGILDGVMSLDLPGAAVSGRSRSAVAGEVTVAFQATGRVVTDYDHVIYVLPDSIAWGSVAGFATLNGRQGWFKSEYAHVVIVQTHEIGHNLNLLHSGIEGANEYDDPTCRMGNVGFSDDAPVACFNAAKSYFFGWYDEPTKLGHVDVSPGSYVGTFVGIDDYINQGSYDDSIHRVVARVDRPSSTDDLYLMFNRQEGVNAGVQGYGDEVVIVSEDNNPGQSWVQAHLPEGGVYTETNWGSTGFDLMIIVCEIDLTGPLDFAVVLIVLNDGVNSLLCPDDTPSAVPSLAPSNTPTTSAPTATPTTSAPSANPTTSAPSQMPSPAPSTSQPSQTPTSTPTTSAPSANPTTSAPTGTPTTSPPTNFPSQVPTMAPTTSAPSESPTTSAPTGAPTTSPPTNFPSDAPTLAPTTSEPTASPTTSEPTAPPTTSAPTSTPTQIPTEAPVTSAPTSGSTDAPTPSDCVSVLGEPCTCKRDSDCCSGKCSRGPRHSRFCMDPDVCYDSLYVFGTCRRDSDCCSGICSNDKIRWRHCLPNPHACHDTLEEPGSCEYDGDCCSEKCSHGPLESRFCMDPDVCYDTLNVPGTCYEDDDCCSGHCSGGPAHTRTCLAPPACIDELFEPGTCVEDSDCCSGKCSNGMEWERFCMHATECFDQLFVGGTCDVDSDCCSGRCSDHANAAYRECRPASTDAPTAAPTKDTDAPTAAPTKDKSCQAINRFCRKHSQCCSGRCNRRRRRCRR